MSAAGQRPVALAPGFGHQLAHQLASALSYALIGAALIAVGFVLLDLTTPGKLNRLVRDGRPNAVVIAGGGTLSIAIIVVASVTTSNARLGEGAISTAALGLLGILVQVFAVRILEVVLRIDVGGLLRDEHFDAAALVVAASHLALGGIIAAAVL